MKKNIDIQAYVKKILTPVKKTKENAVKYELPSDPRDFDEAFIEGLETASKKLKDKNLLKDTFDN